MHRAASTLLLTLLVMPYPEPPIFGRPATSASIPSLEAV